MKLNLKRNLMLLTLIVTIRLLTQEAAASILEPTVSLENSIWKVFTHQNNIRAMALSEDGTVLWIGTESGLEQRDATTGELRRVLTIFDGLPENDVRALTHDDHGGLWIGIGDDRLAHLSSSYEWTVFNLVNSGLSFNRAYTLLSDENGGVWMGSWYGLLHFNSNSEWTVFDAAHSDLPDDDVSALLADGNHGLWIGTLDGGLAHFSAKGQWTLFKTTNSDLPDNDITALTSDDKGGLWIGTYGGGLVHFDGRKQWEVFNTQNSDLPDDRISTLIKDDNHGIWVGTQNSGLTYRSSQGTWATFNTENSDLPDNNLSALLTTGNNKLWLGTETGHLVHFNIQDEEITFNVVNANLPDNNIRTLLSDDNKGVWLGSYNGGLAHLNAQLEWKTFNTNNSQLPDNNIRALVSDNNGGLWLGTERGGLVHFDNQYEWTLFNIDNSKLPENHIRALLKDDKGGLWLGMDSKGLVHFNERKQWTLFDTKNAELPHNSVRALVNDNSGGLWIGTDGGGLAHFNQEAKWKIFNTDNSELPDDQVRVLIGDGHEGLWIGTYHGGLVHFNGKREWTIFNQNNSALPDNNVRALMRDSHDGLWIGTDNNGLVYLDSHQEWTVFNTNNAGLPDNSVRALLDDNNGGLWVATEGGFAYLHFGHKPRLVENISDEAIRTELLEGQRAAILIVPRSQDTGYQQAITVESIASHVYRTLQLRGYDNDEIYFLFHQPHIDINDDGFIDHHVVDAPLTTFDLAADTSPRDLSLIDIQQAFDWAKQKGQLVQPLLVVFIGYADPDQLYLDSFEKNLSSASLDGMLDDYQSSTGNKVVMVFEASYTGSFVNEGLVGVDRVVVTSTAMDRAYYDNLGMLSFSQFYWEQLRLGKDLFAAFEIAEDKLSRSGFPFSQQRPQLNDGNEDDLAQQFCLNGCFELSSGDVVLESETAILPVKAGDTLSLSVRTDLTDKSLKNVWAVIMTPAAAQQRNAQGFPLKRTPVVNMIPKSNDANLWQGSFSNFYYQGDYVITFLAKDQNDLVTVAEPFTLTQKEGPQVPDNSNLDLAPLSTKRFYRDGEQLRITLPPRLDSQEQYIGIQLPNSKQVLVFTQLNEFELFNGLSLPRWQGGERVIEREVSADLPRGEYQLYLLRVPVGVEPMSHSSQWELGISRVEIE